MSGSLNQVQLIGNLGADPEARSLNNGGEVVNLRVACSESWKDKGSGEKREKTEWINVVIFGNLTSVAKQYLRKGSKVYLAGKLQTRKWADREGNDRYTTEVVLNGFDGKLLLLDSRRDSQGGDRRDDDFGGGRQQDFGSGGSGGMSGTRPEPASFDTDLDDDVPF